MSRACLIALGSNLGDRLSCLQAGIAGLLSRGLQLRAASGLWESEAFGGSKDLPYLNAVLELDGVQDPWELLTLCKRVETAVGRKAEALRNAPRCLDLDVLAVEGILLRSPALSLPHPRMQGRAFVWRPLAELCDLHRFFFEVTAEQGRGEVERVAGPEWISMQDLPEGQSEGMPEART